MIQSFGKYMHCVGHVVETSTVEASTVTVLPPLK
jgi:hypothetical protein